MAARTCFAALTTASAFLVAGCGGGNSADETTITTTTQQTPRYLIQLNASPSGSMAVVARGRTNLPNGAVVKLFASQAFRFERERDVRASSVADATATVQSGRFMATLGPLNYGDATVLLPDPDYGPIAVVDNAVTVCTQLQTGEDFDGVPRQPDASVRDAVGPSGENLKSSPQATKFGALTSTPSYWLEVTRRVEGVAAGLLEAVADAQGSTPEQGRLAGFCLS